MVQLNDVSKRFGDFVAVDNVNINIKRGEFLTLLGPSGCGKTTTLRMIAGFEQPNEGEIIINGQHVEGVPPYERDVNTVFQSYALFPHMNVADNVAFGLKMKKVPKNEIEQRVHDALKMVQLQDYANRKPDQLSGGQKQRIAIARAIVNNPKVLLLDEPLGALDLKLRKQMQLELKHLQQQLGITFIYVTHDQEEALTMSDRIAVMNKGVIEQIGTPDEIYERPASRFVADFIGETNLFEGVILETTDHSSYVEISGCKIPVPKQEDCRVQDRVYLAVRPERIRISVQPGNHEAELKGKFVERVYVGSVTKTIISINDQSVVISEYDEMVDMSPGQDVYISWQPEKAVVMKG